MRQNYLFVVLIILLTLVGCAGDDGSSKPDDLIAADKMAAILTEIHMAESQVGRYALRSSDSSTLLFNRLNARILKKFAVDTSAYRLSYIYYSSHPDKLEAIYKNVTGELEKLTSTKSASATLGSALSGSVVSGSAVSGSALSSSTTSGSVASGSALSSSTTSGSVVSGSVATGSATAVSSKSVAAALRGPSGMRSIRRRQ